eukprot:8811511-Pyramimonas_sp.AAC.1
MGTHSDPERLQRSHPAEHQYVQLRRHHLSLVRRPAIPAIPSIPVQGDSWTPPDNPCRPLELHEDGHPAVHAVGVRHDPAGY